MNAWYLSNAPSLEQVGGWRACVWAAQSACLLPARPPAAGRPQRSCGQCRPLPARLQPRTTTAVCARGGRAGGGGGAAGRAWRAHPARAVREPRGAGRGRQPRRRQRRQRRLERMSAAAGPQARPRSRGGRLLAPRLLLSSLPRRPASLLSSPLPLPPICLSSAGWAPPRPACLPHIYVSLPSSLSPSTASLLFRPPLLPPLFPRIDASAHARDPCSPDCTRPSSYLPFTRQPSAWQTPRPDASTSQARSQ